MTLVKGFFELEDVPNLHQKVKYCKNIAEILLRKENCLLSLAQHEFLREKVLNLNICLCAQCDGCILGFVRFKILQIALWFVRINLLIGLLSCSKSKTQL